MRAVLASFLAAIALPVFAATSSSLVPELEQRFARDGVEAVNVYLGEHWSSVMIPFNQKTAACELQAVSLAIRLSRSGGVKATQAHNEALRTAVGKCTAFVLAVASLHEVPKYCASVESWTVGQTARELRRRIAAIESDELLRASQRGKSCRAAYLYELHNTRVVLKVRPQGTPRPGE